MHIGIHRLLGTACGVAIALGVLFAPAAVPGANAVTPSITATPSTNLVQEDTVTVTGSGFGSGGYVTIEWCPDHNPRCRFGYNGIVDASGHFEVDTFAEFRTVDASGSPSDCRTEGCFIRASQVVGANTLTATTHVTFDPSQQPLPPQTFRVSPATGLADHDTVHVTGTGIEGFTTVDQCAFSRAHCRSVSSEAEIAPDGSFALDYEVRRFITGRDVAPIDCAAVPCVLLAESPDTPVSNLTAPISFDPAAPYDPLPTISVTPNANLGVETPALVAGSHFAPTERVYATECVLGSVFGPCAVLFSLPADSSGSVSGAATLHRQLSEFGQAPTDCAATGVRCGVVLRGVASGSVVSTVITFDPGVALPSMTVDPSTGLPFRGTVTVRGRHLVPNTTYDAVECATGLGQSACGTTARGTSDGSGKLDLGVSVRRRLTSFTVNELGITYFRYDCTAAGITCSVRLVPTAGGIALTAPITFDPNAPIPPPPSMTVTPSRDLGVRQSVSVSGSGFLPDSPVTLSQCESRLSPLGIQTCVGTVQARSDASGRLATTMTVRKVITTGILSGTDCSTAVGTCVLRATTGGFAADATETAQVNLGFDPAALPPPSPPVTVTPTTDLTDGQTVHVTGSGFAPSTLIGLAMCRAGTTFSLLDCEISNPTWFTDDAAGAFTHDYAVRSHLRTGHGTVDCSAAPRTCVLAAVNTNDYSEFSLTPVSFRPESGPTPVVSVRSRSITEPTGTNHSTKIDLVLSEPTDHVVRVAWVTGDGTAIGGSDFDVRSGTAEFLPGQTKVTVRVPVIGDPFDEPNEWFAVNMFSPSGATLGSNARITILDDDPGPRLRVRSTTVREGDGTITARIPVTLDIRSERDVAVDFVTHHLTARAGTDYVRTRGTVVIPRGHTTGYIQIPIIGDRAHERSEQFLVDLDDATNATIADGEAFLTIHDDD